MVQHSNQYLIVVNFHLKLHESKESTAVITSLKTEKNYVIFLTSFWKGFIERATKRKVIAFYTPLPYTQGITSPVHQ